MKCDLCAKKATVHLTEIVDGEVSEMHLCEGCAREKSVQMEQQFGLADLLAGLSDFGKQAKETEQKKMDCSHCQLNYEDFRKFGRLGCSECYSSFKDNLGVLLKKIHGSNRHWGKAPLSVPEKEQSAQNKIDRLQQLKQQLHQCIQNEDFENAALLRDKIRKFESQKKDKTCD